MNEWRQFNHKSLRENTWKSPLERRKHNEEEETREIHIDQNNLKHNLLVNRLVVWFLRNPYNLGSLD